MRRAAHVATNSALSVVAMGQTGVKVLSDENGGFALWGRDVEEPRYLRGDLIQVTGVNEGGASLHTSSPLFPHQNPRQWWQDHRQGRRAPGTCRGCARS